MTDRRARWLLLSLPVPPPGEAILLVEALRRLGARAVERERGTVVAAFPPGADPGELVSRAEVAVRASTSLAGGAVRWRWLDPEEWTARWGRGQAARRISERLVVVVGAEGGATDGGQIIRLEPSSAFGTAEHATTRSCLRMLDEVVGAGDRVLDVGSGSGVLAIAAAALGAGSALALEADPVACAAARRNVKLNGVDDRVDVREGTVVPGSLRESTESSAAYDGIIANIGSAVLTPLVPQLADALSEAGWLILSGVLPSEREALLAAARAAGLRPVAQEVEDGWWTVRLVRSPGAASGRR